MLYSEITKQIIACAMTVHRTLGNGFQEVIYQRALEIELANSWALNATVRNELCFQYNYD